MKKIKIAVIVSMVSLLAACGGGPLEGKWKMEPKMGINTVMEFKGKTVTMIQEMMGASQEVSIEVSDYKTEEGRVGVVIEKDGNKMTQWYKLIDADTIQEGQGFASMTYHRVK